MAKGAAQRYPVYTTAKANVDALASGLSEYQLRDGRRRPRRSRHQCRSAATGSGPALRPVRPARRREPRRVHPERCQRHAGARRARDGQSGHGELRRLAQQAERRHRLRRGHQRRLRPGGRQRVAGLPAVRPRPKAHPGDGQLRREHRRSQGHLRLVPVAATHAGPPAGDRRGRRARSGTTTRTARSTTGSR